MLLAKLTNRLRGEVRVRVVSGFPERVLNLCGERMLSLWDVCWVSPTEFVCSMSRTDYRVLRQADTDDAGRAVRFPHAAAAHRFPDGLRRTGAQARHHGRQKQNYDPFHIKPASIQRKEIRTCLFPCFL